MRGLEIHRCAPRADAATIDEEEEEEKEADDWEVVDDLESDAGSRPENRLDVAKTLPCLMTTCWGITEDLRTRTGSRTIRPIVGGPH